jgi:hypothetical protein
VRPSALPNASALTNASLPDRPALVTPHHLRSHAAREAIRKRVARQPGLGWAGLLLVVPIALLFTLGAGGPENSLIIFAPLVTFSLPVVAMIAFWWEDWPGTSLRPAWSGWFDTLLVAIGAVLLTMLGQIVVGRLDFAGIFRPSRSTTFPDTLPLAAAAFVAMVQLTLVCEGWPLRRLGSLAGGAVALVLAWAIAVPVYVFGPVPGIAAIGAWQVWLYVIWQGWPFTMVQKRWRRLTLANLVVIGGGLACQAAAYSLGSAPATINAVAATFITAGLTVGMLFEGTLRNRWVALAAALLLTVVLFVLLSLYAEKLPWTRAAPQDWVSHVALNAISIGIILHVAIGRRWPFAALGSDSHA